MNAVCRQGKRYPLAVVSCLTALLLTMSACSEDMQEQPSFRSQEAPRLHSPPTSVPRDSRAVVLAPPARTSERLQRGERLFGINCSHCHGPGGEGDGPAAGYLKELPANLRAARVRQKPEAELFSIITHGKDMMPPFRGELSAEDRWTMAYFVKSLPPL
ncbi:MAG: c-type cytochrome [Nitrospirales bacterium]